MKKLMILATIVSAFFVADVANAQSRSRNQQARIQQGVRHGQLTPQETRQLRMQQQRIADMKRMAMADGRVTARERAMIRRAEQQASVAIRYQKKDRDFRW